MGAASRIVLVLTCSLVSIVHGTCLACDGPLQARSSPSSVAGTTSASASAEAETRLRTTHLLDRLARARLDIPGGIGKASVPQDGKHLQPYWFSQGLEEQKKFHRRVILNFPDEALRDMREALVIPLGSRVTLPVDDSGGGTLAAVHLVAHSGGKARKATWRYVCHGAGKESEIGTLDAESVGLGQVRTWPAETRFELPSWCLQLQVDVQAAGDGPAGMEKPGSGKGLYAVWQDPRLERPFAAVENRGYNVLFIVVDALRSDVVGVHNTEFPSISPAIDALEKSGTTFPQGFANGNTTLLSMNTLLLGAHPRAMGFLTLYWAGQDRRPNFYQARPTYITRILHEAGYVTFGATHNHLYFPGYKFGADPAFDVLQDSGRESTDHPLLVRRALEFMEAHKNHRFLVQVNLIAPHQPYAPPQESLEHVKTTLGKSKPLADIRYLGEVNWVDRHIDLLVRGLADLGLDEETVVLLTSDHGEVMDIAHDCYSVRDQHRSFHLHGVTLYDEELNVPIMFSLPGLIRPQVSDVVAEHVDIVPTLLDLLGLPVDPRMTGRSLKPVLVDGIPLPDDGAFAERWTTRTYREGGYKLLLHTAKDDICPTVASKVCKEGEWVELYHVAKDPRERHEISRQMPDKVKELREKIKHWRQTLWEKGGKVGPNP
ncbi:MAG: sulfatase [Deltaproteobacteria bacterium]|nr:sulfatase [Deltaproteobacteria bacterium]